MGNHVYNIAASTTRSDIKYRKANFSDIFEQVKTSNIHESMDPANITIRECADSEIHPQAFPIILALDITGSMREIPRYFLQEGLTKIISKLMQLGCPSPAILIMAVGDSTCDRAPLQVGQFESGDEQLDLWLRRVYPEGGGGGNAGESYLLAWHFAANYTVSDSFKKRKTKGILITIGDEPSLSSVSATELTEIYGKSNQHKIFSDKQLLYLAQQTYNVYHVHMLNGSAGKRSLNYWKNLLDQKCIPVENNEAATDAIVEIIASNYPDQKVTAVVGDVTPNTQEVPFL